MSGGAKVVLWVGVAFLIYWFVSNIEGLNVKVDDLTDRLNQPRLKPEDRPPIEVTPESAAIVATESLARVEEVAQLPQFAHSEDFRTVNYQGQEFHLTLNQARVTERLLIARENRTSEVHQDTLLENLGIYSKRVRDVFKNSPAFGRLIVKGEKKGTFRLNLI